MSLAPAAGVVVVVPLLPAADGPLASSPSLALLFEPDPLSEPMRLFLDLRSGGARIGIAAVGRRCDGSGRGVWVWD